MWGKAKQMIDDGFIGEPFMRWSNCLAIRIDLGPMDGVTISRESEAGFSRSRSTFLISPVGTCRPRAIRTKIYATANSRQPDHPELHDNFSAIMHFQRRCLRGCHPDAGRLRTSSNDQGDRHQRALWASWSGAMDRTRHPTFSLRAFDGKQVTTVPIEKPTGELFELEDQIARMVAALRRVSRCTAPAKTAAGRSRCAWPQKRRFARDKPSIS